MVGFVFLCFCLDVVYILQGKWGEELLFMDHFGGILLEKKFQPRKSFVGVECKFEFCNWESFCLIW